MIRPQIVPYTEDWRDGVAALAASTGGDAAVTMWDWNPATTFLAIHHGRVVGFIAGWWGCQPVAFIDGLLVAQEMQGRGIGMFLAQAMTEHLLQLGAMRVRFITENDRLERMLSRCGYRIVGRGAVMEGGL